MTKFRHLSDRTVHTGYVWDVAVATYEAPDGHTFERDVVRSPGAVAVVPVLAGDGEPVVVLIRQYRPAHDTDLVEIPAGMRDVDGESDEDNARRELREEVGLLAGDVSPLTTISPSPGMTDASDAIFLATGCTPTDRAPHGPEEEHAEVLQVALAEAVRWVEDGRIRDAKSVIGVLLAARRLLG